MLSHVEFSSCGKISLILKAITYVQMKLNFNFTTYVFIAIVKSIITSDTLTKIPYITNQRKGLGQE